MIQYLANLRCAAVQGRVDIFPVVNWGEMKGLPGCVVVWQTMVSSPHDGLHNQVLARVLQWSIVSTCTISKGHYVVAIMFISLKCSDLANNGRDHKMGNVQKIRVNLFM